VSLYIEYQIFLTNIRNGGIRMQRYFFSSASLEIHIVNVCQNEHEKKVIKAFLVEVYFSFLYLIHGAINVHENTCLVFYSFYFVEIYNIFLIITCVKELIFLKK
jgi:hypothetical protein